MNDESSQESAPFMPTSPTVSSALSLLDSVQFQDLLDEPSPEASRSSTPSEPTKTKRKRKAWVFNHMDGTDDMQRVFYNSDGKEVWPCRYCAKSGKKKEYLISGGTKNISDHLEASHSIYENSPMEKRIQQQQQSIQDAMDSAQLNPNKKRKLMEEVIDEKPLDGATLEALFVRWVASNNQALRLVECPEFRAFLTYLNSNVNVYLANSHATAGSWVLNQFRIEKERIRLRLHSSRSKIHVSLDIWTLPNSIPILAIIAHYISEDNKLESSLLALKEIEGSHEGDNIAPIIEAELAEWGIISKLGYLQMDNASNNDTMIKALGRSKYFP
jgi:hypothetical protein